MDKNFLRNSWILAGLLLAITIIIGLLMVAVIGSLEVGNSAIGGIAGLIAAMAVSQIYAVKFKETMPKLLRIRVTARYIAAQIVIGLLFLFLLEFPSTFLLLGIFLIIGISLAYSFFIYWMLGAFGKSYLKALQKKNQ